MRYQTKVNRRPKDQLLNPVMGVFRESDNHGDDESEDEEEDNDIQFLNYKEMNGVAGGKTFVEKKKPKKVKGFLVNQRRTANGSIQPRETLVQGSFHLNDPWWIIKILRTTKGRGLLFQRDRYALSYQIRKDDLLVDNGIIAQFLHKFENSESGVTDQFLDYVRQSNQTQILTFEHLEDLIDSFANFLPEDDRGKAEYLKMIMDEEEAMFVYKAMEYPKIFQLIPQLLPLHFIKLISLEMEDLHALNKDLDERPWVFGFKRFMNKDHHIIGCEAPWEAFVRCGLDNIIQQPYKDALILYDFLKEDSYDGNTCVRIEYVKRELQNLVSNFAEALKFLKRNKIVKEDTFDGKTWLFLYNLYKAEQYIAEGFSKLFKQQMMTPWILDVNLDSEIFDNIRTDPDQLQAAEALQKYPVVVISGKGGCGKTTVVTQVMSQASNKKPESNNEEASQMLCPEDLPVIGNGDIINVDKIDHPGDDDNLNDSYTEQECNEQDTSEGKFPVIIYVAPTGKAANLLGRRAHTVGYTLHQIIFSYRRYLKDKAAGKVDHWKFDNVTTVVVDECSLVAVTTFQTLFRTLTEEAKLCRVILLGDVRQLPSIEAGNFLSDVYRSLQVLGCSVELKTNHRSESQLIVDNATRISLQQDPVFDSSMNFKFHGVFVDSASDLVNTVLLKMLQKEKELLDDKTSQFVSFKKKDIDNINEVACKFYNAHPQKDSDKKYMFRVDDKICVGKNALVIKYKDPGKKEMESEKEEESSAQSSLCEGDEVVDEEMEKGEKEKDKPIDVRLCNGEIFFIKVDKTDEKGDRYLYISSEDPSDPKAFWVNFQEFRKKCKIRHAWARTIHTFQGSETQTVVYYLGNCVSWQNWQHVYTAVTRGKKSVHIIGPQNVLAEAVRKVPPVRYTGLHYQLQKYLPGRDDLNTSVTEYCASQSIVGVKGATPLDTTSCVHNNALMHKSKQVPSTSASFTSLRLKGQQGTSPDSIIGQSSPLNESTYSPKPGPSGYQSHTGLVRTSSPYISHVNQSMNLQTSPVVNNMATATPPRGINSPSNETQWSEMDENELCLMDEIARNNLLLNNVSTSSTDVNGPENQNGENMNYDVIVTGDSEEDTNGEGDKDSDSTEGPAEDPELSDYPTQQTSKNNGSVATNYKLTSLRKRSQQLAGSKQNREKKFEEVSKWMIQNDIMVSSHTNGDEDSESQSILEPGDYDRTHTSLHNILKYQGSGQDSFSASRYQTSYQISSDTSDESDTDDGRSSPSLFSKRKNRGPSTPKKSRLIPSAAILVSPARRKLESLEFSQEKD